ncbi:MAG: apolipoprotein N-acyltransferase [Planctomycetes bacterium]|nr:apolipoprotein N-acyltransferase [Planctomycetota bacterium]
MSLARRSVLAIASGALCVLALPPVSIWPLAFVALAPYFIAIRGTSVRGALLLAFLFSTTYFGAGLWWVTSVAGVPGLALLTAVLTLVFGIPGGLALRLVARSKWVPYGVGAPAAFAATEYLRAHLLTGFPWILLGHSQLPFLAFAQIADLGGVYGISFVLALVAGSLMPDGGRLSAKRIGGAALVVVLATAYGVARLKTIALHDGPIVTAIQANITSGEKHGGNDKMVVLGKQRLLTDAAVRTHPESDLIVWSETMYPDPLEEGTPDGATVQEAVAELAKHYGRAFLVGILTMDRGDPDPRSPEHHEHNSALYFSKSGARIARYDKMHLVPMGEYVPFRRVLPFHDTIQSVLEGMLGYIPNLTPGEEMVVMPLAMPRGEVPFSAQICYESIFAEPSRDAVRKGARFLVQLSNESWYLDSSEAEQMEAMSAFRAIENRVPLFRATNTGISASIDPLGRIPARIEVDGRRKLVSGTLTATVKLADAHTLYTAIGDVFALACLALALVAAIDGWRRGWVIDARSPRASM